MYPIALAVVVLVVIVANIVAVDTLVRLLFDFAEDNLALTTLVMTVLTVYVVKQHETFASKALRVLFGLLGMRRRSASRRRFPGRRREK